MQKPPNVIHRLFKKPAPLKYDIVGVQEPWINLRSSGASDFDLCYPNVSEEARNCTLVGAYIARKLKHRNLE